MGIFSDLDSPTGSDVSSTSSKGTGMQHVQAELLQLANPGENAIEIKLGLNESAQIVLDVIKMAQRAKSRKKECTHIANEAYQLFNAVDGGIKGRAIDVNGILKDHIARLNEDLLEIRKIIKEFASWWIFSRIWSAPRGLQKCHDILNHGMEMYLLLLRCSLAQPPANRRHSRSRRRLTSMDYVPLQPLKGPRGTARDRPARDRTARPRSASQSPYQARMSGAIAF
ncbi:hypothetical protein BDZ97DRAFT_1835994 [Flammula alnicola]|nr:hypothetical protein BDZ97DRAFT_1835994 [Flammula alnicola]